MNAKNFPLHLLWSKEYGCEACRQTMPRKRFVEIKKYNRFDIRATRRDRLQNDEFCMVSWLMNRFVEKQKSVRSSSVIDIDEQLFPTRARCPFTQFMPNKPDKFGIKFWVLAEVQFKYCLYMAPYLGKDNTKVYSLGTHVVMTLMHRPILTSAENITSALTISLPAVIWHVNCLRSEHQ